MENQSLTDVIEESIPPAHEALKLIGGLHVEARARSIPPAHEALKHTGAIRAHLDRAITFMLGDGETPGAFASAGSDPTTSPKPCISSDGTGSTG